MWESRIKRANYLAAQNPAASELLSFYAKLLGVQQEIYEDLRQRKDWLPSGSLEQDLEVLRALLPRLLSTAEAYGPLPLADEAQKLQQASETEFDALLLDYWHTRSDLQFFGKVFLQPWAQWLAETGVRLPERSAATGENRCPFCAGKPQLAFLQATESGTEGGKRFLLCATCLTAWPFRRAVCAHCGEERPGKLGWFHTSDFDHVRIEACDSCGRYLKGIDLTRLGLAVPLVEEVATVALDLWAREQGYTKIELNLVGL